MGSNVVVKDNELITVNNALYGSPRLGMASPIITQYCANEKNHSNGAIGNSEHKQLVWDLLQRFPSEKLAKLVNGTATELGQANVKRDFFEYMRRALIVEIEYSNLEAGVDKTQPRARMLAELWKEYDFSAYTGMFGNVGIVGNDKVNEVNVGELPSLDKVMPAIRTALAQFKSLGWNGNDMGSVTLALTTPVEAALSAMQSDKSGVNILREEFGGVNFAFLPDYMNRGSRVELTLNPLLTHHHGAMPSLWNNYEHVNGLGNSDMFAFETSTVEIEEKGAVQSLIFTNS